MTDTTPRRFCPTCNAKYIDGFCKCPPIKADPMTDFHPSEHDDQVFAPELPDERIEVCGDYPLAACDFKAYASTGKPHQVALVVSTGAARLQTYATRAELLALADYLYCCSRALPK